MEYSILESIVEDFRVAYLGEMEKKRSEFRVIWCGDSPCFCNGDDSPFQCFWNCLGANDYYALYNTLHELSTPPFSQNTPQFGFPVLRPTSMRR